MLKARADLAIANGNGVRFGPREMPWPVTLPLLLRVYGVSPPRRYLESRYHRKPHRQQNRAKRARLRSDSFRQDLRHEASKKALKNSKSGFS